MICSIPELPIRISDVSTCHQSIFVITWLNSLMPRGWNTPWRLYSWEFSHANLKISLSWYPIPIWLDPPPAYIRVAKRLWLNKHSISYLRHRVYYRLPSGRIFTHRTRTLINRTCSGYRYTPTRGIAVFFMKPLVCLIPRGYLVFSYTKGLYVLVNITKK